MSILLDYVFNVTSIDPIPEASVGYLKKVCAIVKPNSATTGLQLCTSQAAIEALTDNDDAVQLLNGGMSSIYLLLSDDLDVASIINENLDKFYTVLVSSDFSASDIIGTGAVKASVKIQDIFYQAKLGGVAGNSIEIEYVDDLGKDDGSATVESVSDGVITVDIEDGVTTAQTIYDAIFADSDAMALITLTVDTGDGGNAQDVTGATVPLVGGSDGVDGTLDLGTFEGVKGFSSPDREIAADYSVMENTCGFYSTNSAKNMFYAFGKLLSNQLNWTNQQYISMPFDDSITSLGLAELMFDDKVSFVLSDDQYGFRLALFACGGFAIVAPYIKKNLEIELQSKALTYIANNQPAYTPKNATLLESDLNDVVMLYIDREWIETGIVEVKLEQDDFVASSGINIRRPRALWRVFAELRQSL